MGGMIANTVACGILLVMNGRAWYQFHESGGLHGVDAKMRKQLKEPLIAGDAVPSDEAPADTETPDKTTKGKKKKKAPVAEDPPTDDE